MTVFRAQARLGTVVLAAATLAGIAWGGATLAAPPTPEGRAAALQHLADCRKLAEDGAQLACYRAAAAEIDAAVAKGDLVVVDREQARDVRRQAFGFSLPSLSLFDRGGSPEPIDAVSLKIESATRLPDGKWLFRLQGGQVWRQIDTAVLMRDPRRGGNVTIKSGALGSYKLSVDDSASAIKVHRDN
jgi:hypothetical protein